MRAIKSRDTSIELNLRKALWKNGIRYRKNYLLYNCRVDIVITKCKIAIFCDGDFWHGNLFSENSVKTNSKYWNAKIKRNIERDLENTIILRDNGWTVIRFWEHEINSDLSRCLEIVEHYINLQKNRP